MIKNNRKYEPFTKSRESKGLANCPDSCNSRMFNNTIHNTMSACCQNFPICEHNAKEETVKCEGCGIDVPLSQARMDEEDANWWCPKCVGTK